MERTNRLKLIPSLTLRQWIAKNIEDPSQFLFKDPYNKLVVYSIQEIKQALSSRKHEQTVDS